ncbi:GNAT family N-acetyltransferase [Marimonas lutisalis]|uniref:GNAT family N-acetyltransferase n=1 Tax=Marimonas lutisalis TaxID=2545756 RepID=UPI0010F59DCF|nr:GNAT family N-acetyltransferase [Marimonas lutisalis]
MSPGITLRPFLPGDYPEARALWEATPGVGLSAADEHAPILAFLARNPGLSLVALHDGRIVGTILVGHDGRRGFIHHLATGADHRRTGIARALVDAAIAGLRGEGIGKCHLMVFEMNREGRAFWHSIGATFRDDLVLYSIPVE